MQATKTIPDAMKKRMANARGDQSQMPEAMRMHTAIKPEVDKMQEANAAGDNKGISEATKLSHT